MSEVSGTTVNKPEAKDETDGGSEVMYIPDVVAEASCEIVDQDESLHIDVSPNAILESGRYFICIII